MFILLFFFIPQEQPEDPYQVQISITREIAEETVKTAVHKALVRRSWNITQRGPGFFHATYSVTSKYARHNMHEVPALTISVTYSRQSVVFLVVSGNNLSSGRHKLWIRNLVKDLNLYLDLEPAKTDRPDHDLNWEGDVE